MSSRGNLVFVAGVLGVLAVVAIGYFVILGPRVEAPPPPAVPKPPAAGGRVTDANGAVEISTGGGEWRAADVGAPVGPQASLRTGEDGKAVVAYGEALDVKVSPDTTLRVDEVNDVQASFVVEEGLVVADVDPQSGRTLRIGAAGTDAVAETTDGRVHLLADGEGNVQAAVTRGSADVTAQGKTVTLQNGFQTSVAKGEAPTAPTVLPKSLLLKIKWPPEQSTAKRRQVVRGVTTPRTRVRVGTELVWADHKGRFRTIVELEEGENQIRAYALDVAGRIESGTSPPIEVDTKAPGHSVETSPDMWRKK